MLDDRGPTSKFFSDDGETKGNMKEYLILIHEPDGRSVKHTDEEIKSHQSKWKAWLSEMQQQNRLAAGKPLTLRGAVIRPVGSELHVEPNLYKLNGQEIVGGYLVIKADTLEEASQIMKTCPVYEFDGFVEVRETL